MSKIQSFQKMFPIFSYARQRMLTTSRSSSSGAQSSTSESHPEVSTKSSSAESHDFRNEGEEFRHLLRHSNFVNMGDPKGKVARGKIYHVVNDDLYIDFGWKFHCVCPKPVKGGEHYVRGAEVLIQIKSLELSSRFLGSEKALTLLEADASIIKLLSAPGMEKSET